MQPVMFLICRYFSAVLKLLAAYATALLSDNR